MKTPKDTSPFSGYQKFVIGLLAFLQFTIILDFMILSPLGATLMPTLGIIPSQFSLVVSAYAFSAGISGFLAAGFADRFDRKKFLLFFYCGFVAATFFCGLAPDYHSLLIARTVTGFFGGVIGSIVFAITTDLFPLQMRGRVMGVVQTAFAASQVLGLPLGLYLSNHWGWHAPFLMIGAVSVAVGLAIVLYLRPVTSHLLTRSDRSPLHHLWHTVTTPRYLQGFATTALLSTGGFMMMPFGSAFTVHNLGIPVEHLPMIYLITGACSILTGPFIGKLADRYGKYPTFFCGSVLSIIMVLFYTRLGVTPLGIVILSTVIMFAGISSRMISASALMSAVAKPQDRGAYMSIGASIQQISGGFAAALAGMIIVQGPSGALQHYEILGYVVAGTSVFTLVMMYFINQYVLGTAGAEATVPAGGHVAVVTE